MTPKKHRIQYDFFDSSNFYENTVHTHVLVYKSTDVLAYVFTLQKRHCLSCLTTTDLKDEWNVFNIHSNKLLADPVF